LHHKRTVTQAIRIASAEVDMRPYIRFAHEEVKGRDPAGQKYHALNPEVFHFQHATYVESLVMMVNTFIRKLDEREHELLYRQCCAWYRRYGISTRPMPASWSEFCEYFEHECRTRLSAGEHFEPFRRQMFAPTDWWPWAVPRRAIRAMQHPRAAELTGIEVSARDRRALRRFAVVSRVLS
jgi:uncharacterized protein (DUF2236 family)